MELTYENMMAHTKKFFDFLPKVAPETLDEFKSLFIDDYPATYPDGMTEAEHVVSHHDVYRAHVAYEPAPLEIMVDEEKKAAICFAHEEAKHPVTGAPVKVFNVLGYGMAEPVSELYIVAIFDFALVANQVKLKSQRFIAFFDSDYTFRLRTYRK